MRKAENQRMSKSAIISLIDDALKDNESKTAIQAEQNLRTVLEVIRDSLKKTGFITQDGKAMAGRLYLMFEFIQERDPREHDYRLATFIDGKEITDDHYDKKLKTEEEVTQFAYKQIEDVLLGRVIL